MVKWVLDYSFEFKQVEQRRMDWAEKLLPIKDFYGGCCCKRCCIVNKTLPEDFLEDTRKRFLEFEDQVDRKAFLRQLRSERSPTGYALCGHLFPICWEGLHLLLGVSNTLLSSVAECRKAQSHCLPSRRVVLGFAGKGVLYFKNKPKQKNG